MTTTGGRTTLVACAALLAAQACTTYKVATRPLRVGDRVRVESDTAFEVHGASEGGVPGPTCFVKRIRGRVAELRQDTVALTGVSGVRTARGLLGCDALRKVTLVTPRDATHTAIGEVSARKTFLATATTVEVLLVGFYLYLITTDDS